jgi:hypothetical protein
MRVWIAAAVGAALLLAGGVSGFFIGLAADHGRPDRPAFSRYDHRPDAPYFRGFPDRPDRPRR